MKGGEYMNTYKIKVELKVPAENVEEAIEKFRKQIKVLSSNNMWIGKAENETGFFYPMIRWDKKMEQVDKSVNA